MLEARAGVLNSECAAPDLLSEEAEAAYPRLAGSSFSTSAPALGKRKPSGSFWVILIEDAVSVHLRK